jgi:hypothetical protein
MYAKIINNAIAVYPYTLSQLREDNPYTSFTQSLTSEELAEFNAVIVEPVEAPVVPYTETVTESIPVLVSGIWQQTWVITQATEQEVNNRLSLKASEIRVQRNSLLSQSDWTQVLDAPVDQPAWATYRQALRDITAQPSFPLEVVWPQQGNNYGT